MSILPYVVVFLCVDLLILTLAIAIATMNDVWHRGVLNRDVERHIRELETRRTAAMKFVDRRAMKSIRRKLIGDHPCVSITHDELVTLWKLATGEELHTENERLTTQ